MQARRWINRPEGSNWGDFGPDDQLGRLNLLTAERRRQAAAEIIEGQAFCLSLPLDFPGGNALFEYRHPPRFFHARRGPGHNFNFRLSHECGPFCDVVSDDAVMLYLQYSTQWDSFAHVGQMFDADGDGIEEKVYYNGFRGGIDIIGPDEAESNHGAHRLSIATMAQAAIQGRGVLVDLKRHFGDARTMVDYEMLMRIMAEQGATIETGDILCLYTGFSDLVLSMNRQPDASIITNACAALDGRDERLLEWITRSGTAAICADNFAVEAYPARIGVTSSFPGLPLHNHCLFKLGIPLGELWYFAELASWLRAKKRTRFFLTAPPLRLPGAVGSPVTPVATV